MAQLDVLKRLNEVVASKTTDLEAIYEVVAQAYAWMPFDFQTYYSDADKQGEGADKYNAKQLRALKNDPERLQEAVVLKKVMAGHANNLLERAYKKHGSRVLPKWEDKKLDISGKYWDEVKGDMEGQFTELDNHWHIEALAVKLAYGMRLDLDVQFGRG